MHPFKIHPDWIKKYNAHTATVLGFLVQRHTTGADEAGWFTAPHRLLADSTGIRPETYLAARKRLEDAGVLETNRDNPQLNKYRLNLEEL